MDTFKNAVLQKLRDARKRRRWTQAQLAEKLSVSRLTVTRWESGERTLDLDTIDKIAKALGVSVSISIDDERPEDDPMTTRLLFAFHQLSDGTKDKLCALLESVNS